LLVAGSSLDPETRELLDASIEVDMLTPRSDGSESRRPIWVVVADGDGYVRSYLGERGAWYQRALADGRAALEVAGRRIDVAVEPVHDEDINRKVSDAFQAKYGDSSPGPTQAMVSPEVTETTLRLLTSASQG
jgi:hypothetical protein